MAVPRITDLQTRLISIRELSELTGLTYPLARRLVNRGDLPSISCGPRRRIDLKVVAEWLAGKGRR